MQRADQGQFGESYKVAPMSNYQVQNQMSCFKVDGAKGMEVTIQAILPDLKDFKVLLMLLYNVSIMLLNRWTVTVLWELFRL